MIGIGPELTDLVVQSLELDPGTPTLSEQDVLKLAARLRHHDSDLPNAILAQVTAVSDSLDDDVLPRTPEGRIVLSDQQLRAVGAKFALAGAAVVLVQHEKATTDRAAIEASAQG